MERWEGATFAHHDPRTGAGTCIAEWAGTRIFVPGSVMRAAGLVEVNRGDRVACVTASADNGLLAEAIRLLSPAPAMTAEAGAAMAAEQTSGRDA